MKRKYLYSAAVCVPVLLLFVYALTGNGVEGDGVSASDTVSLYELTIADAVLQVEVVDTPQTRSVGLMHRASLADDRGMLFVFPYSDLHCFWMKNTHIPLDIAFIDTLWRIIDIQAMQPHSEDLICPPGRVLYALEVNQGWFAARGIESGVVELSAALRARITGRPDSEK
jgi:uncharacterized protein